jgi:subtilisin family serine protease
LTYRDKNGLAAFLAEAIPSRERRISPMKKGVLGWMFLVLLLAAGTVQIVSAPANRMIGVNVVLNADITRHHLAVLKNYGKVLDVVYEIKAVTLQARENKLPEIQALPFVLAANPDAERQGAPVDTVSVTNFTTGLSTWNLDAVNVTNYGSGRTLSYNGAGVFVAVLDTGLVDSWRQYFPQERIAAEYAKCLGGGGGDNGNVSEQPDKWEHDQDSHGTHVTSTILGYSLRGIPMNGVAPLAKVIPVKVLNQAGWGWSSVIARGIVYVAGLKEGPLAGSPVVINMSLSGPALDALEKAAIDYAIDKGVIVVAAAGNYGLAGMGYPGAYAPVISVGAAGWNGEWQPNGNDGWWYNRDVPDPTNADDFYIADYSSRAKTGQDLDVVAPGSWVVGPYQTNSGQVSYYFLDGTSMASPHVAGIVALMAQKNPYLTAAQAESILENSAVPMPAWGSAAAGAGLVRANFALNY